MNTKEGMKLDKEDIIQLISIKLRDVRLEVGYTQDRMAEIIGLSKKTLVQIEKNRLLASWSTVVTTCALFRETNTIISCLGDKPLEILETVALETKTYGQDFTMGGVIWWKVIAEKAGYKIQQNHISQHYRILDNKNYRIFSTMDEKEVYLRFNEITSIK